MKHNRYMFEADNALKFRQDPAYKQPLFTYSKNIH